MLELQSHALYSVLGSTKGYGLQFPSHHCSFSANHQYKAFLFSRFPNCMFSQLHIFLLPCPISLDFFSLDVFSTPIITFQHRVICDGWIPSGSPRVRCLCCLEQKRVSGHLRALDTRGAEAWSVAMHFGWNCGNFLGSRSWHPSGQNSMALALPQNLPLLPQGLRIPVQSCLHTLCLPSCPYFTRGSHKLHLSLQGSEVSGEKVSSAVPRSKPCSSQLLFLLQLQT